MRLLYALPILLVLLTFPLQARAASPEAHSCRPVPQLSVRGEALLEVPADQLRLTVGVVTQAETASRALEENSAAMQRVEKAIQQAGLSPAEYHTGQFSVEPQWSSPPRPSSSDWRPRIVGYTAANTLQVKTPQLELAGRLIEESTRAGANRLEDLTFDLADPRQYRAQAIEAATLDARQDARTLAAAASVALGPVLSLTLEEAAAAPRPMTASFQRAALAEAAALPPLTPGEITVRAGVSLVYAIEPLQQGLGPPAGQ